jgi:hypothetical protein
MQDKASKDTLFLIHLIFQINPKKSLISNRKMSHWGGGLLKKCHVLVEGSLINL